MRGVAMSYGRVAEIAERTESAGRTRWRLRTLLECRSVGPRLSLSPLPAAQDLTQPYLSGSERNPVRESRAERPAPPPRSAPAACYLPLRSHCSGVMNSALWQSSTVAPSHAAHS